MAFRAQGAIESRSASDLAKHRQVLHLRCSASRTARPLLAQGATEYLVLLAVVLIIALVGVALLGFFPGTASDAQARESEIYWESATPVAITEWHARSYSDPTYTSPYLRIRNAGSYPIRITKFVSDVDDVSYVWINGVNTLTSDYFYMAPGEEKEIRYTGAYGGPDRAIYIRTSTACTEAITLCTGKPLCGISPNNGVLTISGFGFEYVQYIEGQQIVKRQIGAKPLIIKCDQSL